MSSAGAPRSRPATTPRAVMVVEDDADISEAVGAALEDHGYAVIPAANGQEALELLRGAPETPALILLDLVMPVMDGWDFQAALREDPRFAHVPIVVVSANADVSSAAEEMSAVAWLRKPVDLRRLLEVVAESA